MSDIDTIYECTPRQIKEFVTDCVYAGLVPFVRSSPGMGKSALMRQVCNNLQLHLIDHRMSTSEPTDMSGLPWISDGLARFMPFEELFPLESTPLVPNTQGWMLFLDEFNSAPRSVQAAAYKLLLDKAVGQHKLHSNVCITLAGNLDTDGAITNAIGTALQSRVVHLKMRFDWNQFLEDVLLAQGFSQEIIAFLSWKNEYANDFKRDHLGDTYACPRTWEFMDRLIKSGGGIKEEKIPLYAGTITSGIAVEFVQFIQVYKNIPELRTIINDPQGCPLPSDSSLRWAVISKLMSDVTEDILGPVYTYVKRFGFEFRMLFSRGLVSTKPELRRHPEFANAMADMSKYLAGA